MDTEDVEDEDTETLTLRTLMLETWTLKTLTLLTLRQPGLFNRLLPLAESTWDSVADQGLGQREDVSLMSGTQQG